MKFIPALLLMFSTVTGFALDKISPDFTYHGAADAFASATPATASDIAGGWMNVGYVTIKGGLTSEEGYWPDGKTTIDGEPGYYYDYQTFTPTGLDAFGNAKFSEDEQFIGAETGKLYDSSHLDGVVGKTGYQAFGSAPGSCNVHHECRIVASSQMLLCAISATGEPEGSGCKSDVIGKPNVYSGFFRKPSAPH